MKEFRGDLKEKERKLSEIAKNKNKLRPIYMWHALVVMLRINPPCVQCTDE